jgi:hypothetical protein
LAQCPPFPSLLPLGISVRDAPQRIEGNALVSLRPIEEGRGKAQVLVAGFVERILLVWPLLINAVNLSADGLLGPEHYGQLFVQKGGEPNPMGDAFKQGS